MARYDIEYQAFRREQLHQLRNMDPDVLVAELDLSTDALVDVLWEWVEQYIEEKYDGDQEDEYDGE
jgi:hypothetical protein